MKKYLIGLLLALSLFGCATTTASPATEERAQFCTQVAQAVEAVVALKNQGMPVSEFQEGIATLKRELPAQGMPQGLVNEAIHALQEGYAQGGHPTQRGNEAFKACLNQKQV